MAFKFKLQGFLRLREMEEKESQIELGRLRQEEYRLRRLVAEIEANRESWGRKYNERSRGDNPERDMMLIEQYLIGLEATQRHQEGEIRKLAVKIDAQLEVVERAYRARKQMEMLRDRQKEAYEEEIRSKQNRETAELNMMRHLFNTRPGGKLNPAEGGLADE